MSGIQSKSLQLPKRSVQAEHLGYFRFGRIGNHVVLTNDAGEFSQLTPAEFDAFLVGKVEEGHPRFDELRDRGFLRADLDLEEMARKIRRKRRYLGNGPHLAVIITTLRCN